MDTGYLSQQVTTIVNQLHGYFDEIGIPSHERDSRESELFSALSETLHNQLKHVASEKQELTEQARQLIQSIRQMEASLDDTKPRDKLDREDEELSVTYPLLDCLEHLKNKHQIVNRLFRERFEQIKKLAEALHSYASHLEPTFLSIKLPPLSNNARLSPTFDVSPTYVSQLDNEFTRVYEEYNKRVATVQTVADEIVTLWTELGTPQAQIDSNIVKNYRESPEQLGLRSEDIARIKSKRDKLAEEKRGRERRLKELRVAIEALWEKLGQDVADQKAFLAANRGCGLRAINEFEDELARLEQLKRQNLHLFVEDARVKLQKLWDDLYFSEEEMLEFAAAFSDVFSDALLSAHEAEISRLEILKEQRAPTLAMVDKHRSLLQDRINLAASSQDASRLLAKGAKGEKRDPTRLLREEKMRKRIAKDLPKVESELRKVLQEWEEEYGRPFLVHGDRYLDEIEGEAPPPRAAATSRPKTPSALLPNATTRTVRTAPPAPASQSRHTTIRDAASSRAKTPTNRSQFSASTRNPPSTSKASTSTFSQSVRASPTKAPTRAPLSSIPHGSNSPQRKPISVTSSRLAQKVPTKLPASPPKLKSMYGRAPPTPSAATTQHDSSDLSADFVRQVTPEDVYDDRSLSSHRSQPSWSTSTSQLSRPGSVLHHYQTSRQPCAVNKYPSAPPPVRQMSNTSSIESTKSAICGSENWETFSHASDTDEPNAREAYYSKIRTVKRVTPDGGHEGMGQSETGKRIKAHGHGLGIMNGCGNNRGNAIEGSEAAWTDEGSVY